MRKQVDVSTLIDDSDFLETFKQPAICVSCRNLIDYDKRKCLAFDRIPDEIWSGKNKHVKPFAGDNGVQYEDVLS